MPGDDRLWRKLKAKIDKLHAQNAHVKVGVLGTGETAEDGSLTMVELAAIHEFGSPAAGIPERSFIRFTVRNKQDLLNHRITQLATAFVNDKISIEQALGLLGATAAAEIKNSITSKQIKQDLKPATIKAKGSTTALIDTGRLLQSITWKVESGNEHH